MWSWKEYVQYINSCLLGSNIFADRNVYIVMGICCFMYSQGPPRTWWQHPTPSAVPLLWDGWRPHHHQSIRVKFVKQIVRGRLGGQASLFSFLEAFLRANCWIWRALLSYFEEREQIFFFLLLCHASKTFCIFSVTHELVFHWMKDDYIFRIWYLNF